MAHDMLVNKLRNHLLEPLGYGGLVAVLKASTVVLTDSSGIQEESPALAKPVLVLRKEKSDRRVVVGVTRHVGVDENVMISAETARLLDGSKAYEEMAQDVLPYGEGQASRRIVAIIKQHYGVDGNLRIPVAGCGLPDPDITARKARGTIRDCEQDRSKQRHPPALQS